jgi:hypothetical protein
LSNICYSSSKYFCLLNRSTHFSLYMHLTLLVFIYWRLTLFLYCDYFSTRFLYTIYFANILIIYIVFMNLHSTRWFILLYVYYRDYTVIDLFLKWIILIHLNIYIYIISKMSYNCYFVIFLLQMRSQNMNYRQLMFVKHFYVDLLFLFP